MKGALNGATAPKHNGLAVDGCECPTCGSVVSPETYAAIMGERSVHEAEIRRQAEASANSHFASREATIRREAGDAAKAALAPKLAEAADIKRQMRDLRESFETTVKQQLAAQAEALEKAANERVNAEKEKRFADNLKHQQELEDLRRRTAKERPQELGDQGELDLFELLMAEFPQDQIARVPKGVNGADIVQRIFVNGICVGANCFEVKNHKRWQNAWIAKLREDTIEAGASHGILITAAFPADRRELTVIDNVVVAAPARAIAVAHILRRAVVAFHALRLTNQQRDEKADRLYAYLTSDKVTDRWDRIAEATGELRAIETADATWQDKTRTKRLAQVRAVEAARDELQGDISVIVAGTDDEDLL